MELQGRAREIIYRVNKAFEIEKLQAKALIRKLNNATIFESSTGISKITISSELFNEITEFLKATARVSERIVKTTGVNKNTVVKIKREGLAAKVVPPMRKPRKKSVELNNNDLCALSDLITRLYEIDNDIPSLTKIQRKARTELNFQGSMSTLRRILIRQLGYKFTRGHDQSKQITFIRPNVTDDEDDDYNDDDDDEDDDMEIEYLEIETEDIETQDGTYDTSNGLEETGECSDFP